MNYFVLFSVVIIVISLVILISPLNYDTNVMPIQEGFKSAPPTQRPRGNPVAASQTSLSGTAGMADGSSDHQYLLDNLLKKHDRLAEGFENRNANASKVSATTTKKKGIASTGATYEGGDNVPIPVAGCNNNKCMKIKDPMKALDGNCINPPRPGMPPRSDGLPQQLDYSIKFCPAFEPKDGSYAEECLTCGYYKYTSKCTPNPNNPKKPCDYETYTFDSYNDGPMPGTTNDGGDDGGDDSGPNCSTCKYTTNEKTKCVLPGCYSDDDGYLPFPDGDYNFAEGCFYYDPDTSNPGKNMHGMAGRPPGYYCPPISKDGTYDGGGGSSDPCYTKQDPYNLDSSILDYSKYVQMENVCTNDKAESKQNFNPDDVDDNPMNPHRNKRKQQYQQDKQYQHQHQHSGAINVYHHHRTSQNSQHNMQKQNNQHNMQKQNNKQGQSNSYQEPLGGATVLGYL